MKLLIPVGPLSVNAAYSGRHFATPAYKQFKKDVAKFLLFRPEETSGELYVKYTFFVKNYKRADLGNMEKTISDMLVEHGYMRDDSDIKSFYLQKERVKTYAEEKIEVTIYPYDTKYQH